VTHRSREERERERTSAQKEKKKRIRARENSRPPIQSAREKLAIRESSKEIEIEKGKELPPSNSTLTTE